MELCVAEEILTSATAREIDSALVQGLTSLADRIHPAEAAKLLTDARGERQCPRLPPALLE